MKSTPTYHPVPPLLVTGDYACFTRGELKAERVSYDVITPSAARGIVEAILWKPQIAWCITEIRVLKEIGFTSLARNEVSRKLGLRALREAQASGDLRPLATDITQHRVQRRARILRDVSYVIQPAFRLTAQAGPGDLPTKYQQMFQRRARRGQCFHQPYLGCREFPAAFEVADPLPVSPLRGTNYYGWMLYDMDFADPSTPQPRFYQVTMQDGVIRVPPPDSAEVCA